jgi:YD repeat-containing protein
MTGVAVGARRGEAPQVILKTDYDSSGRVVRQVLPDGSIYKMEYVDIGKDHVREVKVTDPDGRVLDVTIGDRDYTASMKPVRFPAVATGMRTSR